jgi:hypothetical protein
MLTICVYQVVHLYWVFMTQLYYIIHSQLTGDFGIPTTTTVPHFYNSASSQSKISSLQRRNNGFPIIYKDLGHLDSLKIRNNCGTCKGTFSETLFMKIFV